MYRLSMKMTSEGAASMLVDSMKFKAIYRNWRNSLKKPRLQYNEDKCKIYVCRKVVKTAQIWTICLGSSKELKGYAGHKLNISKNIVLL